MPSARQARLLLLALLVAGSGCGSAPPRLDGAPGAARDAGTPWPAPPRASVPVVTESGGALPVALSEGAPLALADVVDIALGNGPATRAAWADAKAAAAAYGAARGALLPTVDLEGVATRATGAPAEGEEPPWSTLATAGASLSWLLFDFGGRAGAIEAAKQAALAANWTHNAVIQDAVLAAEVAYFAHAGAAAILAAGRASLAEAESSLAAADARHEVGLATIADVLQARTAVAQARLDVQAAAGDARATRGALALTMGLRADTPLVLAEPGPAAPVDSVGRAVDALIDLAVAGRPDLQAARASAAAAAARVRQARAALLPSLSMGGAAERVWPDDEDGYARHSASLRVDVPLFAGGARRQAWRRARAEAEAAAALATGLERQAAYEVFVAHSDLRTAAERVATTAELLASAARSAEVALGRYREGVGDVLDLLTAQRALAQARAQEIDARYDWSTALARLARDAGVLGPRGDNPLAPGRPQPGEAP